MEGQTFMAKSVVSGSCNCWNRDFSIFGYTENLVSVIINSNDMHKIKIQASVLQKH